MAGTPCITVTRWSCRVRRAASPENRGSRARQAPARTAALSPAVCPREWNSGRPAEDDVLGRQLQQVVHHDLAVAQQVGVGELDALGLAGRARRVQDHGGVAVRHGLDRVERRGVTHQAPERARPRARGRSAPTERAAGSDVLAGRRPGHQDPHARVLEVLPDHPLLEQRVHRDHDRTEAEDPVVERRELRHVRHHDPDAVPGLARRAPRGSRRPVDCPGRARRTSSPGPRPSAPPSAHGRERCVRGSRPGSRRAPVVGGV